MIMIHLSNGETMSLVKFLGNLTPSGLPKPISALEEFTLWWKDKFIIATVIKKKNERTAYY